MSVTELLFNLKMDNPFVLIQGLYNFIGMEM
jgi:hypothetical protein